MSRDSLQQPEQRNAASRIVMLVKIGEIPLAFSLTASRDNVDYIASSKTMFVCETQPTAVKANPRIVILDPMAVHNSCVDACVSCVACEFSCAMAIAV